LHDLLEFCVTDARIWANLRNLVGHTDEHKHQGAKRQQRSGDPMDKHLEYTCIEQQAEEDGAVYVAHGGRWNSNGSFNAVGSLVAGRRLLDWVSSRPAVISALTNLPPDIQGSRLTVCNPLGLHVKSVGRKVWVRVIEWLHCPLIVFCDPVVHADS